VTEAIPGILAIFNNISVGRESEFEEWFQHEHLAERLAVPGFLLARRHEAVSAQPRYFNFYVTQSADILNSAAYLARLDDPTPMTRRIMSEVFKDMIRTICNCTFRLGVIRGAATIAVRYSERPDEYALKTTIEGLIQDKAVACGEIWSAVSGPDFPISEEERLRRGDHKFDTCLVIETLRIRDAERIAASLSSAVPQGEIGVYKFLCELRAPPRRAPQVPPASVATL
jgi:hypothetical protein